MNSKESRQKRIKWFTDARFGMFIHWGLYAIPARESRSEWIRSVDKVTDEEYQRYFDTFNPTDYNPKEWAKLAKEAGMKYAVLTTKHHDGFCLFDSKYTDFKSTNTPCKRDLVKEYVEAFRAEGIKVGFYYSLLDWHHPDYPAFNDAHHPMRGNENYKHYGEHFERYIEYMHNQVKELMTNYGKIDILWFDFHYDDMTGEKWEASKLIKMVREINPDVIIDDRLGGDIRAEEKPLYVGDFGSPEQMIPSLGLTDYKGNPIPWETCMTLNNNWGYSQKDENYKNARNVINMLVQCVSKGGNLILNVGPDARGNIPKKSVEILKEVGEWMKLNGECVYNCTFSGIEKHEFGRITKSDNAFYLYIQDHSGEHIAIYGIPDKIKCATLLCDGSKLSMADPWNVDSYRVEGKTAHYVATPPYSQLNGNGNVIKLWIEK
ncbi:MAG: alpha-L-fucosidase [Clostridia bacterium]|nr:alpha-L-fucosidase [Clostridia bacterium]